MHRTITAVKKPPGFSELEAGGRGLQAGAYLLPTGTSVRSLSSKMSTLTFLLASVMLQIHSALMPPSLEGSFCRQMLPREAFWPRLSSSRE